MMIKPGQYFHTGEILQSHIFGREKLCVAVDGNRVTYRPMDAEAVKHGETGYHFFCLVTNVVETFNTIAELRELRSIGAEHYRAIQEFTGAQHQITDARIAACRARHAKEWAAPEGEVRAGLDRTTNGTIGQP